MSVIQLPRAAARSVYRDLYRAASSTFKGDGTVLKAFRDKMRQDALAGREITEPGQYEQQVQLARDIAVILRKNIVQGVKEGSHSGIETWSKLYCYVACDFSQVPVQNWPYAPKPNWAPTIVSKLPLQWTQYLVGVPRKEKELHSNPGTSPHPHVPIYYSALKKAHKERRVPILLEEDIEETFVRGSGPGGQSINKTENNVQLLHKPTGIRVSCQETRSLSTNRKLARRLILERLDRLDNPGLTKNDLGKARQRERERRRRKKAKKKELQKTDI
ncbi:RF-1 domain containing protein [Amanita muscaria]